MNKVVPQLSEQKDTEENAGDIENPFDNNIGKAVETQKYLPFMEILRNINGRLLWGILCDGSIKSNEAVDPYVFAAFFANVGMFTPVVFSIFVYSIDNEYDLDSFSRLGLIKEPFGGLSNLSFWSCSLGLLFFRNYRETKMPEQRAIMSLLLCLMGAGSLAFHVNGSPQGDSLWRVLDEIGMYCLFTTLPFVVLHGAFHSIKKTGCANSCLAQKISHFGLLAMFTMCLLLIKYMDYSVFLICGAIIVIGDAIIYYNEYDYDHDGVATTMYTGMTFLEILGTFKYAAIHSLVVLLHLSLALYVQHLAAEEFRQVKAVAWCPPEVRSQSTCACDSWGYHSLDRGDEYYIHTRNRFDLLHGYWHFLVSIVITEMILVATMSQSDVFAYNGKDLTSMSRLAGIIAVIFAVVIGAAIFEVPATYLLTFAALQQILLFVYTLVELVRPFVQNPAEDVRDGANWTGKIRRKNRRVPETHILSFLKQLHFH